MSINKTLVAVTILSLVFLCSTAFGDAGKPAFERGKALVGQGDFEGAMQAFAAAARAERSNPEYMQNYSLVRQVIMIRSALEREKAPERWEYYAQALHTYYVSESLYDHALELARQLHERVDSAGSAALLAETQLAMNRNAEAVELLSGLAADKTTVVTESLEGIALARLGKKAEALKHADLARLGDDDGPGAVYCVARLQAATENVNRAASLLIRCFEQVPPSQLDGFKNHARATPEFAGIAGTREFQQALKTESKVQESRCSGGSSCANCPMRGNCGKQESR